MLHLKLLILLHFYNNFFFIEMSSILNKRIFDTDNALKGSFNGRFGKWQLLSYSILTLAFAIISSWISKLTIYTRKCTKTVI
jgi:hypothetical protein